MPQDYTISAVSSQPPREWQGKFGLNRSYKVKFAGSDAVVELVRKASELAPVQGEILNGTIEQTEYGPKFKKARSFGGGKSFAPRDDSAIRAQWAIGQAVHWYKDSLEDKEPPLDKIETLAGDFFAMAERVKAGPQTASPDPNEPVVVPVPEFPGATPINPPKDEIPF